MFRACELKDQTYKKTRTLHFSELYGDVFHGVAVRGRRNSPDLNPDISTSYFQRAVLSGWRFLRLPRRRLSCLDSAFFVELPCDPDCPVQTPNRASGLKWEKMAEKCVLAPPGKGGKNGRKWENGHF